MVNKYIIIATQDYSSANHKELWKELARTSENDVIIVDIPADYVVSVLKKKFYRIQESKQGVREIAQHLYLVRPLLWIRPELLPDGLLWLVAQQFWSLIRKKFPDIFTCRCNIIIYDARWARILLNTHPNMKLAYYLYDEVRHNGRDYSINKERTRQDEFACRHCDVIFTMTKCLAESRNNYNNNILLLGNGAQKNFMNSFVYPVIPKSVAFVGNFRDWIDVELLENLIKRRTDTMFCFVGSVEGNMQAIFDYLLHKYPNMAYFGRVSKEQIFDVYRMFGCVIIPYLNNPFIKATRPIKIVESVFAGTPVVTIPMNGYNESEFIRFASNVDDFDREIDFVLNHPIDIYSCDYIQFCLENSWTKKTEIIIDSFERI